MSRTRWLLAVIGVVAIAVGLVLGDAISDGYYRVAAAGFVLFVFTAPPRLFRGVSLNDSAGPGG